MIELTDKKKKESIGEVQGKERKGMGNVPFVPGVKNISGRVTNWQMLNT